MRDKVARQCPQTTTFEEKGEPKQIRTVVPLPSGKALVRLVSKRTTVRFSSSAPHSPAQVPKLWFMDTVFDAAVKFIVHSPVGKLV